MTIGVTVPWNAGWSSEERFEIRPCRWAEGRPALWQPHSPGIGRPIFAKPHSVRQRQSIAKMLCTVCGEQAPVGNRWWFQLGEEREGYFMTTESPVHRKCADHALKVCPHLRARGERALQPMPGGWIILASVLGGTDVKRDFGINIAPGRTVLGALKLGWKLTGQGVLWTREDRVA